MKRYIVFEDPLKELLKFAVLDIGIDNRAIAWCFNRAEAQKICDALNNKEKST